jgi:hypothetical protein
VIVFDAKTTTQIASLIPVKTTEDEASGGQEMLQVARLRRRVLQGVW